jgi:homoserine O-acetyltransferase/O-succinyltransferase
MRPSVVLCFVLAVCGSVFAQTQTQPQRNYPTPVEGDYVIKDFHFRSGETLPELKMHYRTIGTLKKNSAGVATNAVIAGHGTGGNGGSLLNPSFANVLFGPDQLLDATKYFIILPDGIGHGKSSKPSDGLHMKFPKYTYDDMVEALHEVLTKGLGVNHLRLVMGTSMGGMQTWVWGEMYPDFMDALMPLASNPVEIAGRNRVWRFMVIDAIKNDPEWMGGEYKTQPMRSLTTAEDLLLLAGSAPLNWQAAAPTREAAEKFYLDRFKPAVSRLDANDLIYQLDASREYNPALKLESIKAPLIAVNSADDFINPPELGIIEREIKRVKRGKFVNLPISNDTRGHGTHTIAKIWQGYLKELLDQSNTAQPSDR